MKIYVEEVNKVSIKSSRFTNLDKIKIDSEIRLQLGKEGIKDFLVSLMHEFRLEYKDDELVEILQDPDFESVRDCLIVTEVAELDTEIRLLKEELKEVKTDLLCSENLVRSYEDFRD